MLAVAQLTCQRGAPGVRGVVASPDKIKSGPGAESEQK